MTNNDELALKLKARIERALEDFTNGRACMHVPPLDTDVDLVLGDCLALLAERDTDKKVIAELNATVERECEKSRRMVSRIAELEALTAEQDKRLIAYAAIATKNASEARTVSVKIPAVYDLVGDCDGNGNLNEAEMVASSDGIYARVSDLAAAGIKLEVGE